jgi:hypothetical protein
MIQIARKRPRKPHVFRPILSDRRNSCEIGEYCQTCMEEFSMQAERDRPGHVWAVDKGRVIFLEDVVYEHHLGRPLRSTESIVHRDGDFKNNALSNLELVIFTEPL